MATHNKFLYAKILVIIIICKIKSKFYACFFNYIDFIREIIDFFCSADRVFHKFISSFCSCVKVSNSSSSRRKSITVISKAEQIASNIDKVGEESLLRQLYMEVDEIPALLANS